MCSRYRTYQSQCGSLWQLPDPWEGNRALCGGVNLSVAPTSGCQEKPCWYSSTEMWGYPVPRLAESSSHDPALVLTQCIAAAVHAAAPKGCSGCIAHLSARGDRGQKNAVTCCVPQLQQSYPWMNFSHSSLPLWSQSFPRLPPCRAEAGPTHLDFPWKLQRGVNPLSQTAGWVPVPGAWVHQRSNTGLLWGATLSHRTPSPLLGPQGTLCPAGGRTTRHLVTAAHLGER